MNTEIIEFNPFKLAGTTLKDKVETLEIKDFNDVETGKTLLKECTELEKRIEDVRTSITKPVNDMIKNINNMAKEVALPVNEAKLNVKKKIVDFNEQQEKLKKQEEERIQRMISKIQASQDEFALNMFTDSLEDKDKNNFIVKTAIETQKTRIEEKIRADAEAKTRAEEQAKLDEEKKKMSEEQAQLAEEKMKLEQEKREFEAQKKKEAEEKELAEKNKIVEKIQNTETDKVKGMMTVRKREIIDETLIPRNLCSPDSKKINEALKNHNILGITGLKIREEKTVR